MRNPRIKFIIAGSLLLMAVAMFRVLAEVKPPVSVTVLGRTNRWWNGTEFRPEDRSHVLAHVSVANRGQRPVKYWAIGSAQKVEYEILRETSQGWKAPGGFRCGTGLTQHTLSPNQEVIFEAVVESDRRIKVEFGYFDDDVMSRVWMRLPSWMQERLPWWSPWRSAVTAPVDFGGTEK